MPRGVRNLRGIGGIKPIPGHIFIPPKFSPVAKFEIVTSSNTYDITEAIEECSWTDGATEGIGDFEFKIIDPIKTLSNNVINYSSIKIYLDYGANATTLKFKGKIERSGREDYLFVISGRSEGIIVMGKNINYSATNIKKSEALKEIIQSHFPTVSITNIEENTELITMAYSEIPFQEVVNELNGNDFAFYIDPEGVANYFEKSSRKNLTEAVVEGQNHISTAEFTSDSEETVTKIRVYGKETGGLPLISTSNSSTELTDGIDKEDIIQDDSLTNIEQTQERADNAYLLNKSIPKIGSITSFMLPTISPGEQIKMFVPMDNMDPAFYNVASYTHTYPNFNTTLNVQQKRLDIPKIFSKSKAFESKISGNLNPNDMDYTLLYDFSEDSGIHDGTKIDITTKTLKTDGSPTGIWTSDQIDSRSGENINSVEVRVSGNNLEELRVFLSFNGGLTFTSAYLPSGELPDVPVGNTIIVRVFIHDVETVVDAVGVYYKT